MSCLSLNTLFYIYYIGLFFFEAAGKNDHKHHKKHHHKHDKNKKNHHKPKNGTVSGNSNKVKQKYQSTRAELVAKPGVCLPLLQYM